MNTRKELDKLGVSGFNYGAAKVASEITIELNNILFQTSNLRQAEDLLFLISLVSEVKNRVITQEDKRFNEAYEEVGDES